MAINFSRLHLTEATTPADVKALSAQNSEKAMSGGNLAKEQTRTARANQGMSASAKKGLSTQTSEIGKEVMETNSFRSLRTQKELITMRESQMSDWRDDLKEAVGPKDEEESNHPYVEVMPDTNYKAKELMQQIKAARQGSGKGELGQSIAQRMPMGEGINLSEHKRK